MAHFSIIMSQIGIIWEGTLNEELCLPELRRKTPPQIWATPTGSSLDKRGAWQKLFVFCSVRLLSYFQLYLYMVVVTDSFGCTRTMASRHPLLTGAQWLSRKLSYFQCLTGTTEAASHLIEWGTYKVLSCSGVRQPFLLFCHNLP